jgi:hypothetical protein
VEEPSKDGMIHLVLKAFPCFIGTILYAFSHDKQKKDGKKNCPFLL